MREREIERERERARASKRASERAREREREREREKASVRARASEQASERETHTHTHTANNRSNRSDPHAARMQHPPQHHREVLRRSSGAARKDSCTACERTAFTPCRRTHSAAHTRRRWREEPTSTWPHRRQARRTRCTLAPSTPPPAPARAASTMVKGPHHTTHSGSAPPSLRTHSSSAHPDAQPKPCNAWPRHGRAPTPPAQTPRPP